MSQTVIQAESLSKKYYIGAQQEQYQTLRDALAQAFIAPWRRLSAAAQGTSAGSEEFWALQDISFEIKQGEVVGLIGHNGAGKSTLLKILSRITTPTSGYARIHGRVGSLLEVGTGFHQELTGRENVYLNGAILGMHREEIERKFEEIVEFAEMGKFIDTPVKRYSSGMIVRLAFSVAAHLEPEILLIDEVLAVGDYSFQQKCLGKMDEVSRQGRTIIFVSHSMAAIHRLCNSAMLLQRGKVLLKGTTDEAISKYLSLGQTTTGFMKPDLGIPNTAILREVGILNDQSQFSPNVRVGRDFEVLIVAEIFKLINHGQIALEISSSDGTIIFMSTHTDATPEKHLMRPGIYRTKARIPRDFLQPGDYSLGVRVLGRDPGSAIKTYVDGSYLMQFRVEQTGSNANPTFHERPGLVTLMLDWDVQHEAPVEPA